jgi:hypothetical protein
MLGKRLSEKLMDGGQVEVSGHIQRHIAWHIVLRDEGLGVGQRQSRHTCRIAHHRAVVAVSFGVERPEELRLNRARLTALVTVQKLVFQHIALEFEGSLVEPGERPHQPGAFDDEEIPQRFLWPDHHEGRQVVSGRPIPARGPCEIELVGPLQPSVGLRPKGEVLDEVGKAFLARRGRCSGVDDRDHSYHGFAVIFFDDDSHPGGEVNCSELVLAFANS